MTILPWLTLFPYLIASFFLVLFGLHCYYLVWEFLQSSNRDQGANEIATIPPDFDWPKVTTQIAIYNEVNVAERVINAVAAMDYPLELHQIQVVDDSTDETRDVIDRVAAHLLSNGVRVEVCRRATRNGFKAGALREATRSATGEFLAIFDSDFVPSKDFLRKTIAPFADPEVAVVQSRWGHLNQSCSFLTAAQAIGIDGHFVVEQTARSRGGLFLNFNGTGGVWRKSAMEQAGGWEDDTLTEDLDLSYRTQLAGGKISFLSDVVVPGELPESFAGLRAQQFRWAKGSTQTAIKLLPKVLKSEASYKKKIEAIFHLCGYSVNVFMLSVILLALPVSSLFSSLNFGSWLLLIPITVILAALGPTVLYYVAQSRLSPTDWWKQIRVLPCLLMLGFGLSVSNTRGVIEALLQRPSEFVRTPKRGDKKMKTYQTKGDLMPWFELAVAGYCFFTVFRLIQLEWYGGAPVHLLFGLGLVIFATGTLFNRSETAA